MKELIFILALILMANEVLYYSYFWQLKEYRWDRMRDFLSTASGRERIFPVFVVIKFMVLFAPLLFILIANQTGVSKGVFVIFLLCWYFFVAASWFLEFIDLIDRLLHKKLYRPDKTIKAALIVFLSGTVILGTSIYLYINNYSTWLLLLIAMVTFTPLIPTFWIAILTPFTWLGKKFILKKAARKISQMPDLKIIGITGSYGKSSVKEFLAQILSDKYSVLKTPGNTNTEIGVAKVILKNLKAEHEVFILEAGAYKIGEIEKIGKMVKPQIAIVTAVRDSHLALFGSLENIKKAKFELIESLTESGVAIFNGDDMGARDLADRAASLNLGKIIRYGWKSEGAKLPDGGWDNLQAEEIKESLEGISFKVKGVKFFAPVPGRHNVSNLMAAIAGALEVGMTLSEIAERVKTVKLRDHTLTPIKISEDLVLIDDTYNANPDGVIAGLEYLKLYREWRKILVFPGMLELGESSESEHKRVAKKVAEICDFAYFTSRDFEKPLTEELKKNSFGKYQFIVEDQSKLLAELRSGTDAGKTVILFSSRGAEQVIKQFKNVI